MARSVEAVWLTVPVNEHDHWQGSWNASVTLVEYGDYECPYCAEAEPIVKHLQEALGGKLLFVYRNFPLVEDHPQAQLAAEAAEAAGAQGLFWDMHDMLFANQGQLDAARAKGLARTLELDQLAFEHALREHKHADRIERDVQGGEESHVEGTPTFYINGRRYDGPVEYAAMLKALKGARR